MLHSNNEIASRSFSVVILLGHGMQGLGLITGKERERDFLLQRRVQTGLGFTQPLIIRVPFALTP
jgi:hypothetical protein